MTAALIKLEAPDYKPIYFLKGLSVCHIGSGSDVADYEKTVTEFFDIRSATMQAAGAGPAAWAQMLGNSVGRPVQDDPREGISPHVHIQICTLGGFQAGDNNMTRVYPMEDGSSFGCRQSLQTSPSLSRSAKTSAKQRFAHEHSGMSLD